MFKNKVVWIIIAIVAILFFWVKGVYNNMVTQRRRRENRMEPS